MMLVIGFKDQSGPLTCLSGDGRRAGHIGMPQPVTRRLGVDQVTPCNIVKAADILTIQPMLRLSSLPYPPIIHTYLTPQLHDHRALAGQLRVVHTYHPHLPGSSAA